MTRGAGPRAEHTPMPTTPAHRAVPVFGAVAGILAAVVYFVVAPRPPRVPPADAPDAAARWVEWRTASFTALADGLDCSSPAAVFRRSLAARRLIQFDPVLNAPLRDAQARADAGESIPVMRVMGYGTDRYRTSRMPANLVLLASQFPAIARSRLLAVEEPRTGLYDLYRQPRQPDARTDPNTATVHASMVHEGTLWLLTSNLYASEDSPAVWRNDGIASIEAFAFRRPFLSAAALGEFIAETVRADAPVSFTRVYGQPPHVVRADLERPLNTAWLLRTLHSDMWRPVRAETTPPRRVADPSRPGYPIAVLHLYTASPGGWGVWTFVLQHTSFPSDRIGEPMGGWWITRMFRGNRPLAPDDLRTPAFPEPPSPPRAVRVRS